MLSAVAASTPKPEATVVACVTLERTLVGSKPSDDNWKLLRFPDLDSAKRLLWNRLADYVQRGADSERICSLLIDANAKHPRLLVAGVALQTFGTPVLSALFADAHDLCRQLTPGEKARLYDEEFIRVALHAMAQGT